MKIAFVAEGYTEENNNSGGSILNQTLLKKLKDSGNEIDIYSKKFEKIQNFMSNYYPFEALQTIDIKEKYDLSLSEKGVYPTELTYIHDHSYKYRIEQTQSKFSQMLYCIFYAKHHQKRLKNDKKIKENLKSIEKIIVSSTILKEDFEKNFEVPSEKLHILPPPVLNVSMPEYAQKNETVIFGLSANGFVNKGGYILIDALSMLKKKTKNFKVKIIYQKARKNLWLQFLMVLYGLNKHVEFLPTQNDMNNFYKSLDYCIVASRFETFSMVAIEAMAHYKPVIISSVCGATDYIKDGENGFVIDYKKGNKSKNLAEGMLKAINTDKTTYKTLATNAHKTVQPLTLEEFVKGIRKIGENKNA